MGAGRAGFVIYSKFLADVVIKVIWKKTGKDLAAV